MLTFVRAETPPNSLGVRRALRPYLGVPEKPRGGMQMATLTTLLSFNGANGDGPHSDLIADAAGDLFGTTVLGGASGDGAVFELVNHGGGNYTLVTLYAFTGGADGSNPLSGLIADAAGDLFGTTYWGGASGYGAVFELVNHGGGNYTPVTLYSFTGGADGRIPQAGLITDAAGDLFGTTN